MPTVEQIIQRLNKLQTTLLQSGIQQTNQPLYQVITQLIQAVRDSNTGVVEITGGSGGGPLSDKTFVTTSDELATLPSSSQIIAGDHVSFDTTTFGQLVIDILLDFIIDATLLTSTDESADFPNSRNLLAGTDIAFDDTVANERTVNSTVVPVDLDTDVTGVLPVANGGTGIASLTVNRIPFGDGTNPFQSDADLIFDGTELNVNALVDISGAAGGQIQFPATQNPSTNANILDDFEEGTWTPVDASGAGLSLTSSGSFVKIGKIIFISAQVIYPVTADGSSALIGGLPFTTENANHGGYSVFGVGKLWLINANATTISPLVFTTSANFTNAGLSGSNNVLSGMYRATA